VNELRFLLRAAKVPILAIVAILTPFCLFDTWWTWTCAGIEARAYERVTGKHVSQWDAYWLNLRVQEAAKGSDE